MVDLFLEIDTIALFVILVELAFLVYHMQRMNKQDRRMEDLIKRFEEHCFKLDAYVKQAAENKAMLDTKKDGGSSSARNLNSD